MMLYEGITAVLMHSCITNKHLDLLPSVLQFVFNLKLNVSLNLTWLFV